MPRPPVSSTCPDRLSRAGAGHARGFAHPPAHLGFAPPPSPASAPPPPSYGIVDPSAHSASDGPSPAPVPLPGDRQRKRRRSSTTSRGTVTTPGKNSKKPKVKWTDVATRTLLDLLGASNEC